jgi:hypothetical protein
MTSILSLTQIPENPIERLVYLDGVLAAARAELDAEFQRAYFDARVQGMFPQALNLGLHSQKKAVAFTRHENEKRSRAIWRWRDGY